MDPFRSRYDSDLYVDIYRCRYRSLYSRSLSISHSSGEVDVHQGVRTVAQGDQESIHDDPTGGGRDDAEERPTGHQAGDA